MLLTRSKTIGGEREGGGLRSMELQMVTEKFLQMYIKNEPNCRKLV